MTSLHWRLRAAILPSRIRFITRSFLSLAAFAALLAPAHAVIVRGRVTDSLGRAVPGARVQLIERGKVAAIAYAADDGSYEIRSADAGRFHSSAWLGAASSSARLRSGRRFTCPGVNASTSDRRKQACISDRLSSRLSPESREPSAYSFSIPATAAG